MLVDFNSMLIKNIWKYWNERKKRVTLLTCLINCTVDKRNQPITVTWSHVKWFDRLVSSACSVVSFLSTSTFVFSSWKNNACINLTFCFSFFLLFIHLKTLKTKKDQNRYWQILWVFTVMLILEVKKERFWDIVLQ